MQQGRGVTAFSFGLRGQWRWGVFVIAAATVSFWLVEMISVVFLCSTYALENVQIDHDFQDSLISTGGLDILCLAEKGRLRALLT